MIHLTINLIAFALSAIALWLAVVVNRRLIKRNKEQQEQIEHLDSLLASNKRTTQRLLNLCAETQPNFIKYTVEENSKYGYINVCKEVGELSSVIKCFADPDQDYNRREAEELVEKLNEK